MNTAQLTRAVARLAPLKHQLGTTRLKNFNGALFGYFEELRGGTYGRVVTCPIQRDCHTFCRAGNTRKKTMADPSVITILLTEP